MADNTVIEWTDATWNPITGCSIVSPGCTNCYAMRLAGTRLKHTPSREGLTRDTKAGPVWNGQVRLNRQWLYQPFDWKRPRRIFVCAHGDLFAENVPDEWILDVFTVMAAADHHTYQVLTKRAGRMHDFLSRRDLLGDIYANWYTFSGKPAEVYSWPLHNVWLGVSAERQNEAEERVPQLLYTPAAMRFVSAEPLLGPIEFTSLCTGHYFIDALCGLKYHDAPEGVHGATEPCASLDQIIVGGESGPNARPMHPNWARGIRNDCARSGAAFFFKQWGAFRPLTQAERGQACGAIRVGNDPYDTEGLMLPAAKKAAGRLLDGVEHSAFPEIREVPFR